MADTMTPQQRRHCMQQVRGKDTQPEMVVRRWLWHQGFRYRLHDRRLPGSPDIVLRRLRAVVLVNGCFWHGHEGCPAFHLPKTRTAWWRAKIERNRYRDRRNARLLEWMGWHVITIWECELTPARRDDTLQRLSLALSDLTLARYAPPPAPYAAPEPAAAIAAEPTPVVYSHANTQHQHGTET